MADDEERIKNGDMSETEPGPNPWDYDNCKYWGENSDGSYDYWDVGADTRNGKTCCFIDSYGPGIKTWTYQDVDLTNVHEISWEAIQILNPEWCGPQKCTLEIDDSTIYTSYLQQEDWTEKSVSIPTYTGIHRVKFCVHSVNCGAALYITNVSAIASAAPTINAILLWQIKIGPS